MTNVSILMAYDLGGRIKSSQDLRKHLERAGYAPELDSMGLKSFNLSYINWHEDMLVFKGPNVTLDFEGKNGDDPVNHEATTKIRIYPWLGIIHVELNTELKGEFTSAVGLSFYEGFVTWKNRDYLPYLEKSDQTNGVLKARASEVNGNSHTAICSIVQPLVDLAEKHNQLVKRPQRYVFHDVRMIFEPSNASSQDVDQEYAGLLSLLPKELGKTTADYEIPVSLTTAEVQIQSSGWVTVIGGGSDTPASHQLSREIKQLVRLTHAQWFICQIWINVLGSLIAENTDDDGADALYELANFRVMFDSDLTEVGNENIMLKDPYLVAIASQLSVAFAVDTHRHSASTQFESVSHVEDKRIDLRQRREANALQMLFSISAAVAIALLIPELWEASYTTIILTVTLGSALLAFFIYRARNVTKRFIRRHNIRR